MKEYGYLEIRQMYLDHLEKNFGHTIIPSASLVPEDDPTVLFVNAGMFPLVPYLLGESHPEGTKLANSQRCVRTGDIDEVGDATHLTAFEMLGNWSLNEYFKKEAIKITVGFYVDTLGIDINNIYASVFEGNDDASIDNDSIEVWKEIFESRGVDAKVGKSERIQPLNKKENWWELAAGGPCGPDSEIFFDTGADLCGKDCNVSCSCGKFIEVGNNVFMQYLKDGDNYSPLGRHNVDFGGGLDRLTMISQGVPSIYETKIYLPILNKVKELAKEDLVFSQRIIVDHIKAATWMIADGVVPGRSEREYILRRLIRRAIRHAKRLGIEGYFIKEVASIAITQFTPVHSKLETNKENILNILQEEEEKFNKTLLNGLKEVAKIIEQYKGKTFTNEKAESFTLFETHGFPVEMLEEELKNTGVKFDSEKVREAHDKAFQAHQDKSRSGSAGLFKGGLADTSEESTKLHTATHLLLAALRKVVGEHIFQKGSNITPDRLRLDYPNDAKLTPEQVEAVEKLINEQIQSGVDVTWEELPKDEAMAKVPFAAFDDKYGEIVKLYHIGEFSTEICGGPHVENTKDLGKFRIKKQESVGAGIKRIKAVLE